MAARAPTPIQDLVLRTLADLEPAWTLTGGGALCLVHLGHRDTRDLDLFFHGEARLGPLARAAAHRLRRAGGEVAVVREYENFAQLDVRCGGAQLTVDLVADPAAHVDPPVQAVIGDTQVLVDAAHEILVNKLTTLLSRSEVRDLFDVRHLLRAGGDLERALADAPVKDGGFSPLRIAWLLDSMNLDAAAATGLVDDDLRAFRDDLVVRLVGEEAG